MLRLKLIYFSKRSPDICCQITTLYLSFLYLDSSITWTDCNTKYGHVILRLQNTMERAMCQSISKQKYASMEANIPEVILHVLKWFCNHQYLLDPFKVGRMVSPCALQLFGYHMLLLSNNFIKQHLNFPPEFCNKQSSCRRKTITNSYLPDANSGRLFDIPIQLYSVSRYWTIFALGRYDIHEIINKKKVN